VDFGGREEGVLEVRELKDAKGELTKKLGDTVQASVVSTEGGIKLTISAARKKGNLPAVLEASRNGTPLEGRVTGVNKGGLVVRVMGVRAFCPFSQIDRHYVEDPSTFIGKRLTFRVSSADEKGKNVVLSRRAHLEEEVRGRAHLVRAELAVGKEMTGVVARLRPFGAFVDLGGIDGLVHVSEISHTRLTDPAEALKVGQEVRVKVVKIEKLGEPGERISLSIKGLQTDPWDAVSSQYQPGTKVEGKIVRLVDFGAFVELAPGVDGLIHVSALAAERVEHPSKVVNVGDPVHAWIVKIEPKTRRISLSLVEPQARAEQPRRKKAPPPKREERPQSREARDFRKTPSGMTSMEEAFERLRQRRVGD
jgi:small subunit ribosomal protein S1